MTYRLTRRAYKQRTGNWREKFVLVVTAYLANGHGRLFYNRRSEIAQATGLSERAVTRHLQSLERQGLLALDLTRAPATIQLNFA